MSIPYYYSIGMWFGVAVVLCRLACGLRLQSMLVGGSKRAEGSRVFSNRFVVGLASYPIRPILFCICPVVLLTPFSPLRRSFSWLIRFYRHT